MLHTRYAFDVDPESFIFKNRRVFCYIDSGIPDGIQVDTKGNVYVASGDGIQVNIPNVDLRELLLTTFLRSTGI